MIRINLRCQVRPKAARRPVPLGAMFQLMLIVGALALSIGALWLHYAALHSEVRKTQEQIGKLKAEKLRLEGLKQEVDTFDARKKVLTQRINVIEQLQRDRTGGQELLDTISTTVSRTDALWLTSMSRKGNTLVIEGTARSMNAVANYITQMRRSGYFQKIEIKESRQDEKNTAVQTFIFTLNAEIAPAGLQPAGAPANPSAPAPRKGEGTTMAFSFREFPWYLQLLLFTLMALLIFGLGEFVPFSPVQSERVSLEQLLKQKENLQSDVTQLQVYERRYADFKRDVEGLQKQLDTLKTIVPEEKELDEFIRLVQGAASASNVQIRRLVAEPVVPKEYHYEMPFQIQADGPYFNILDFFSRMSRLSRIINVGDLQFDDPEKSRGMKYPVRPGSTVSAVFVVTTYFTKIADTTGSVQAVKAPGKQPGKP